MAIAMEKKIDKIEGPVTLNVTFKHDLALDHRIERAAHKRADGSGTHLKSGIRDMSFTFKRKGALKNAISRIRERMGSKVKIQIAAAN